MLRIGTMLRTNRKMLRTNRIGQCLGLTKQW